MSTVYILGAGFSMPFGYPSSRDLLGTLNKFAGRRDALDPELKNKWERRWKELDESKDDAVRCAFEGGNIEELFTVLDFHQKLLSNRFSDSTSEWASNMATSGKGLVGKKMRNAFSAQMLCPINTRSIEKLSSKFFNDSFCFVITKIAQTGVTQNMMILKNLRSTSSRTIPS